MAPTQRPAKTSGGAAKGGAAKGAGSTAPPKSQAPARGSAASTKTATKQGHHVTTVASGNDATAAPPTEPPTGGQAEVDAAAAAAEQTACTFETKAAAVPAQEKEAAAAVEGGDGAPAEGEDKALTPEQLAAKAEAEAAAAKAAAEAEAARLKELGNGEVTLLYEMYDEKFPIVDGSTTSEAIDEVYCLSYVMANCKIKLAKVEPQRIKMEDPTITEDPYVQEEPEGTFHGLCKDTNYWVYVVQDPEQEAKDRAAMAERFKDMAETAAEHDKNEYGKEGLPETCSCIYGNPCVDEYGCKDWTNRYAIATKNGWKGF